MTNYDEEPIVDLDLDSTVDGEVDADALDDEDFEDAAEDALDQSEAMPSRGLLSFYDRLRGRIVRTVERRGGRLGASTVKALLLVPDVFMLLARLALDPEVPSSARALVGGALAYFVLPFDLMPEGLMGGAGFLDDLVLAMAVLAQTFDGELAPYAKKHWSGSRELREVIADITSTAHGLLGDNLYSRLQKLLSRRGIELDS